MPSGVARRLVAAGLPVAAVAFTWASLELAPQTLVFGAVAAAALLAALPARLRSALASAAIVLIGVIEAMVGHTATAVTDVVDRGMRDTYEVLPPFEAAAHPELHALVVLGATVFGLAIAVTAGRKPLVAAAVTATGVCSAAVFLPARNTVAIGALTLLATLWPVVVVGIRERRAVAPAAAVLAGVVVVAALAAGAGTRPSVAALDWKTWDLFGPSQAARTVALVWRSDYDGIEFPATKTTVLRITAPRRALYWRATTLDVFVGDRWVEALYTTGTSAGGKLPPDSLLPRAAKARSRWVEQRVDVRALVDAHVTAAGQPMEIAADADREIHFLSGGVIRVVNAGSRPLRRYSVWSFAPDPTPASLVRSPARYPGALARYLDVGRTVVPSFGSPGREGTVETIFHDELNAALLPYEGMWRQARRLTARAQSPYQATIQIERWLRTDGGFTYDERPPFASGVPPLVGFLEQTKLGYCQQFAGTMALMLRYLGIPARVAVGFTSGRWKNGTWTVTDHDAHAWVEAWFAGYGWLTFDPTPGRGTLSALYTNASDSAEAIRALGTDLFLGVGVDPASGPTAPTQVTPNAQPSGGGFPWWVVAPFAVLAAAVIVLALAKGVQRRRRFVTSDPRLRASAARAELAGFVRDQGAPVPAAAPVADLVTELRRLGVGSDAFAAAFSRARYGPPAGAAAAADDARRELRRVISLLRSRLGPGRRIRGFLMVRSLRSD